MLSKEQIRNVGAMAVGLFALIAVAACMPKSEPGKTEYGSDSNATVCRHT